MKVFVNCRVVDKALWPPFSRTLTSFTSEENSGRFSDSSESESDFGAVGGQVEPYMFEPEAVEGAGVVVEEEDEDGLSPDILEARKEKRIPVSVWCKCGACGDNLLSDAREYRCCQEILSASGKLV
ncbi:uncharacterized protein LOC114574655 [Exaiptasia diaphana]|uniref:Uncharacterized protein n=1 Tax=Exaiptasia diaphana TaxID=2652724 RepID=A0A913YE98_EXADI|nr:uncharacterized protein LOC114574655 [Exaiptasia diaphana]